jgi:hypothetical protein
MNAPQPPHARHIERLHQLYRRLTGQRLSLRFDRQRLWHDFLQAGFTAEQLTQVIRYLQKEIRHGRRNVGALKLSNLLQPDRFEEDFNISRVRLQPPPTPSPVANRPPPPACSPAEQERRRQIALRHLHELKDKLRKNLL